MTTLDQLLVVQEHDTRADQLRHRRTALPERQALVEAESARKGVEQDLAAVDGRRHVLGREQKRLEDDIALTQDRVTTVDRALYGRNTSNPRELQALQDEVNSLKRRISLLEDEELVVLEQLEPIDAARQLRAVELARLEDEIERLSAVVTAAEAELDVELQANLVERAEAAGAVATELMAEYEAIRARSAGVGVARLVAGVCGGCHLRLPAVEVDRIKKQPPDVVVHCDDCGRLLVR